MWAGRGGPDTRREEGHLLSQVASITAVYRSSVSARSPRSLLPRAQRPSRVAPAETNEFIAVQAHRPRPESLIARRIGVVRAFGQRLRRPAGRPHTIEPRAVAQDVVFGSRPATGCDNSALDAFCAQCDGTEPCSCRPPVLSWLTASGWHGALLRGPTGRSSEHPALVKHARLDVGSPSTMIHPLHLAKSTSWLNTRSCGP